MPKICYVERKFSADSLAMIGQANRIFAEYQAAGYILTLRQLYYQFVSRDLLPNNVQSYKRLGSVINDARLAGLVDWELMEDRTRNLQVQPAWSNPAEIVSACAQQLRIDKWADQDYRPEVWCEKDALAGVFERVCQELQAPYFSCRGYTSQSEMWVAGRRLAAWTKKGQTPLIFHFGDHDPSGIDMTRDITDRLELFMGGVKLERLALNMDQVEEHEPPPNPAKITDSRAAAYIEMYGDKSWELDALPPDVLAGLVRDAILAVRDEDEWQAAVERENEHKRLLGAVSQQWTSLTDGL
jgi:hypothetical protein